MVPSATMKRRVLRLPRVLGWGLVAGGVGAAAVASGGACSPSSESQSFECAAVVDGSLQTFKVDASTCPDGETPVVV